MLWKLQERLSIRKLSNVSKEKRKLKCLEDLRKMYFG